MISRFIQWWIRNAAYIAPIATVLSAFAALMSVTLVYKSFKHSRQDRRDELDAKHPRFKVSGGGVRWVEEIDGDYTIPAFYELFVIVQNVRETSAKQFRLDGVVYLHPDSEPLFRFERQPTHDIETGDTIEARKSLDKIAKSNKPYFVRLSLSYKDTRTGDKHPQTLYQKFYLQSEDDFSVSLLPVDKAEQKEFSKAQIAKFEQRLGIAEKPST
jgi:hypothetical protein